MEENEGLPLIHFVRDYYMNTFINYNLGDILQDDRYALFYNSIMGIMYGLVLNEKDSYLATLIQAETPQTLASVINLGYTQAHG